MKHGESMGTKQWRRENPQCVVNYISYEATIFTSHIEGFGDRDT